MEFRVLGPVEAERDGDALRLGGPKQRALLALLLLRANEVVSRDQLIDGLWGEHAPVSAAHTIEDYISRLRKIIGSDRITTRSPGYVLRLENGELDLQRFEKLVREGDAALADGLASQAADRFRAALGLWRGDALADVIDAPFASAEAGRLEDARVSALEHRVEADLAAGRDSELIGELERLTRSYPLRERPVALLTLALYRSGRQSDALAEFRDARRRLVDGLGVEPGPALQTLHRQILEHDPGLTPTPISKQPLRARGLGRSRWAFAAVAAAAGVAAVMGAVTASRSSGAGATAEEATSNQVLSLNADSGRLADRSQLVGAPAAAATDSTSVWLAEADADSVTRIDASSGDLRNRIAIPDGVGAVAAGGGAVWALAVEGGSIVRIDPATARITQRIGLGGARASALAFGQGSVWVADGADNALIEIEPENGTVQRVVQLALRPTALAPGPTTIWVADYDGSTVAEVDPGSGQTLATIHVGNGPGAVVVADDGAVWVANTLDSTVSRIDPARAAVVATVPVGSGPTALAAANGSVWTADRYSGSISRIDVARNVVADTTAVGGEPTTLTAVGRRVWIGLQPHLQQRGGTLRLLSSSPLSIDPAIQVNVPPPQSGGLTTDGLVAYNRVGGPAGLQLVPDLAIALPTPTDGGRTYTFRLRPRIQYSDGRFVGASDFRRAFERLFHFRSLNTNSFRGILGAAACIANPATCDLSRGVVTNDAAGTVTFHLSAPDPNFLTTLTYGSLSAPVPPGTPLHTVGLSPIPGTGPYRVASASQREIRYVRNPRFREWSHAAQPEGNPDEIVMRVGLSPEQEVQAIEKREADGMVDAVPAQLLPRLQRRYASQLHSYPSSGTDWLQVNTRRPPFDDIRVRRALNFAIDRRFAVRTFGGPRFAAPACQMLPPGVPGYHRYCPYTRNPNASGTWTAPDLARARRLVDEAGTHGARVTVWGFTDDCCLRRPLVEYQARLLRRLGYRVTTRYISHAFLERAPARFYSRLQLTPVGWADPTADNFFATWVSCSGAGNHGSFCDPRVDRQIRRARALAATDPRVAAARWAAIDREVVDRATVVPLLHERWIEFVSARVRNYQHNPHWGLLASQVSLR